MPCDTMRSSAACSATCTAASSGNRCGASHKTRSGEADVAGPDAVAPNMQTLFKGRCLPTTATLPRPRHGPCVGTSAVMRDADIKANTGSWCGSSTGVVSAWGILTATLTIPRPGGEWHVTRFGEMNRARTAASPNQQDKPGESQNPVP